MHILAARNFSCTCTILEARWSTDGRNAPLISIRVAFAAWNRGMPWYSPLLLMGVMWLMLHIPCWKVFPLEPGEAIFNQAIWIPTHMYEGRKQVTVGKLFPGNYFHCINKSQSSERSPTLLPPSVNDSPKAKRSKKVQH